MATNSVRNSSATGGISILIDQAQEQLESGRQLQQKQQQQQQQQQQQRHATAKNNISPITTTTAAAETTCEVSTASTTSGGGITMLATSNKCNSITSNNSTTFIDINCNEDNVQKWRSALELQKTTATQATAPFSQLLLRAAQAATSHVQDNNHNNDEETSKVTTTTATTSSPTLSERRKTKAEENQKNGHKVHGVGPNSVGISITHEQTNIDAHICNAEQLKPVANDEVVTTTIIACNSIQETGEERDDHHHVDRVHGYDDGNDNDVVESRLVGHSSGGAHSIVCVAGGGDAPDFGVSGRLSASLRQQGDQLEAIVAAHSLQAPDCVSALTESVASNVVIDSHVVKIKISPNSTEAETTKNFTDKNTHKSQYFKSETNKSEKQVSVVQLNEFVPTTTLPEEPRIEPLKLKIPDKMVQKPATPTSGPTTNSGGTTVTELNVSNPSSYLYYMMSSGQFSPCDTLDSGTGSDLESNGISNIVNSAPSNSSTTEDQLELHLKTTKIRVHSGDKKHQISGANEHPRGGSLTDSEESESSLSCDSLNSSEYLLHSTPPVAVPKPPPTPSTTPPYKLLGSFLPDSLLRDIRDRKFPTNDFVSKYVDSKNTTMYDVRSVEPLSIDSIEPLKVSRHRNRDSSAVDCEVTHADYVRERNATNSSSTQRASLPNKTFVLNATDGTFVDTKMNSMPRKYEADKYYDFHVNEHENFRSFGSGVVDGCCDPGSLLDYELRGHQEDAFAGYKDVRLSSLSSTIRSSKGTVRGVKNRVRNGIATFLQLQHPNVKNYKEKDLGKVVLYTTSMGIIRDTYAKCSNVKQILRTLLVKFEERDVFMSVEYQQEIKQRMHSEAIKVPQLFVEGQHIGDAETVERLNESGELRQLLKPYKSISTTYTCQTCGGYRLLPCPSCNGSKKSVHRNHFTAEFVALKCMNCDEVGLVKCHNC